MRARRLLAITAIVSSILGAIVVYLVLTVPNDLKADSMLKTARRDLEAGRRDPARQELSRIVQQYPRTDAAAAATVALVKLADQERREMNDAIAAMRRDNAQQAQALNQLQQKVESVANAPAKTVTVQAPPKKTVSVRKHVRHHQTVRRHHRRRRR